MIVTCDLPSHENIALVGGGDGAAYFAGLIVCAFCILRRHIFDVFGGRAWLIFNIERVCCPNGAKLICCTGFFVIYFFGGANLNSPSPKVSKAANEFANNILDIPEFLKK